MPALKFSHVVSFSSEDSVSKAEHLLIPDGTKKWKSKDKGEKQVSAVLQLKKSDKINSINIGNEGSAFVEVTHAVTFCFGRLIIYTLNLNYFSPDSCGSARVQ